jgi:cyanophycinase
MAKTTARKAKKQAAQAATPPPAPPLQAVPRSPRGSLVVIGGNENKDGQRGILEDIARRVGSGKLVVATLASEEPEAQWAQYQKVFKELGVRRIAQLDARQRQDLLDPSVQAMLDDASVLFFGGGDQLKITSRFGGTELCDRIRDLYSRGATIAGTSSGASVMSETMLVSGEGDESHATHGSLKMAPGLGFMPGVIIDQHFAERGRIGRLVGAVAQNPRLLGLGIDEDTAALFDGHRVLRVMGSGAVYVVDGRGLTYTSAAEDGAGTASVHGLLLHVLSEGDSFDMETREPHRKPPSKPAAAGGAARGAAE